MQKLKRKDFNYYFQRNQFERGSKQLIRTFRTARFAQQGEIIIDGIRLLLIAKGPVVALKVLKKYQKRIQRSGPRSVLRMSYLLAEIAWQKGQSNAALQHLISLREQLKSEMNPAPGCSSVCNTFCEQLLADIDMLAGKCMTHESDHAMARIYFGRSYDHRHWDDEHLPHFSDGQIRMLFARSYFDWRKMKSIEKLLKKAKKLYGVPARIRRERKGVHFHLAEVYTLQARYKVIKGLRKIASKKQAKTRIKKREKLKTKVASKLKAAEDIILKVFDRKHRCYAHILRLRAYFQLEFTLENIKENSGKISDEDYQQLWQIEQCYLREINVRKRFFKTIAHPSIARAYGFLAKTKILQANYLGQQVKADEVKKILSEAEDFIGHSIEANKKTGAGEVNPFSMSPHSEESLLQHPELSRKLSDKQALQAKKFELEVLFTRYSFADLLELDKDELFKKIYEQFKSSQSVLNAKLKWVTSPDSKESFYDAFEPFQEQFIEVCFEEYERGGSQNEEIVEMALYAMHQGRPIEEVNKPFDEYDFLNEHKRKLRLLQTFIYRRLNEEGDLEKFAAEKEVRQEYEEMTNEVFEEHQEYIRQYHSLSTSKDEKSPDKNKEGFSFEAISKGFNGEKYGVAIALHFGKKHAYSIAIQDQNKGEVKRASFVRLTNKDAPYRGVMELKRTAKSFNKVVRKLCDEKYWKKNSDTGSPTFTEAEMEEIKNRILFTDFFEYNPDAQNLADRLNSRFLLFGFKLYKSVFSKLSFGAEDRVYIGINRYRWQRIPLRAIFTKDPRVCFKKRKTVRFSDNVDNFIGSRQQISVLPSIFELWRWGVTSGKKRRKKDFPNDKFYALAGGSDEDHNDDFKQTSVESTHDVTEVFQKGYHRITGVNTKIHVNETVLGDTSKVEVITRFEDAAFIYAFLHTAKEYNEDGRRKIVLYASTPEEEMKSPSFLATFRWDKHCLYQEELANCRLNNVRLTFINSCLSADGRGSFGYVPYSTLSAVYAAGCHVVIGTQIKTYGTPMRFFANYFYAYWMNEGSQKRGQKPQNLPVGEAILYSSRIMATDTAGGCTHPLHWGAYIQIGDMTTRFEDCINKERRTQ